MQPIQMTRAEYEKKYGVKPVFSTSTLDTTPTRVRMTREEYNQIYGPEKKNAILENLNPLSQTNINRIADIPSDIKESYTGIKEAGQTAAKSVSDIWKNKDLNVVQKSAATLPGMLSGAANMAGTAALAPVKLLTTDEFEKNVANTLGKAINDTYNADIPLLSKSMKDIYDGMSDDNKFIVSKLFAPVANVVTSVTTAGKAVPLAEQGVKTVAKNVPDVGATLKKAADNVSFRGEEKALRSVVDEIAKVEEKYAPIRKSNKFAKDVEGSRTRIAQSDVLSKAVDESGKINGEVASKLYKQMTIDDTEGMVRNLLKDENAVISIDSLKEVMENTILKSRLEGNDLVKALDSIEGELKGLRIRGDEAGNIPLYKVHDAKISATDGINYLSPATDKAYRKAIAKTYRQVVEKESKIKMDVEGKQAGIKEINDRLSIYLDDIRRIKALDGRIVDRGKLGKYASSLAGTGIGMAVGAIGGPLASAAGGAIGGKVASKITSTSMQNTFKKGVKGGVPEDKILKAAKLRVADKPLVAPKGVPKTKAIKETEDLIKKNVEMQKTAIKANDFTLVAKLKEIYAKLVAKLKDLVTEAVEAQKNPQIGQKGSVDFFAPLPKKGGDIFGDITRTTPSEMAANLTKEDIPMANKMLTKAWDDIPSGELADFKQKFKLGGADEGIVKKFLREALDEYDERWDGVEDALGREGKMDIQKPTTLMEEATPKTVKVFIKSKFSDGGAMADVPVIRREDNITLYQGGSADGRQFWTPNKKYASQFGEVKEKTGSFYKVDNGNRVTDVYVEVPNKSGSLLEEAKKDTSKLNALEMPSPTPSQIDKGIDQLGRPLERIISGEDVELALSPKSLRVFDPETKLMTVYRVVPEGATIEKGDVVFDTMKAAEKFMNEYGQKRGQTSIVTRQVKLADLAKYKDSEMNIERGELIFAPTN